MNLSLWRTVFGWLHLGWTSKSLHYGGDLPGFSMHLHLHFPSPVAARKTGGEGRVRVGKPGPVDTRFDVLPVSALPTYKDSDACYGFVMTEETGNRTAAAVCPQGWLRWDTKKNKVSLTDQYDDRCEVRLFNVVNQPGKPFRIQARLDASNWVQVRMGMDLLSEEDLKLLEDDPESFEDTSEVSFVSISKEKVRTLFFPLIKYLLIKPYSALTLNR